jgi:hypothetical protein
VGSRYAVLRTATRPAVWGSRRRYSSDFQRMCVIGPASAFASMNAQDSWSSCSRIGTSTSLSRLM